MSISGNPDFSSYARHRCLMISEGLILIGSNLLYGVLADNGSSVVSAAIKSLVGNRAKGLPCQREDSLLFGEPLRESFEDIDDIGDSGLDLVSFWVNTSLVGGTIEGKNEPNCFAFVSLSGRWMRGCAIILNS